MAIQQSILILGSGPSGVMAAKTLVEQGFLVTMIDVGYDDEESRSKIPDLPFSEIRRTDLNQARYFLGRNYEGIPRAGVRVGSQLTPPRQFLTHNSEELLTYQSQNFFPMQSLAKGGLGAGWGAACFTYSSQELEEIGINDGYFSTYYNQIASEIGISGDLKSDIADSCMRDVHPLQPPLEIDSNSKMIEHAYQRQKAKFVSDQIFIGKANLAVLSQDLADRQANPYFDMDFWSDSRKSIYRPRYTIEKLKKCPNFQYHDGLLAVRFSESKEANVSLYCYNMNSKNEVEFKANRLILCAGAINSARIALNSLKLSQTKTPILANPYTYIASINLRMFGKPAHDLKHSLSQLCGIYFPRTLLQTCSYEHDPMTFQFYSYRSLLLFKLVKEMPLPPSIGTFISRLLQSSLTIIGVHHSDRPSCDKWMKITSHTTDRPAPAEFYYEPEKGKPEIIRQKEKFFSRKLLNLGCIPFSKISPGHASSIHYAGTIPIQDDENSTEFGTKKSGLLNNTQTVFIGDSSTWRFLPAKGLTFTLMANAVRVANQVSASLKNEHR